MNLYIVFYIKYPILGHFTGNIYYIRYKKKWLRYDHWNRSQSSESGSKNRRYNLSLSNPETNLFLGGRLVDDGDEVALDGLCDGIEAFRAKHAEYFGWQQGGNLGFTIAILFIDRDPTRQCR